MPLESAIVIAARSTRSLLSGSRGWILAGDDVFALLEQGGGCAEYVSVPERLLARKPGNLSYEQAAAVPMAATTALLGLRDAGRIQPGQKVAIRYQERGHVPGKVVVTV